MKFIRHEIGRTAEGLKLYRNQFIYPPQPNYIAEAHKEFTAKERKEAKRLYKESKKNG